MARDEEIGQQSGSKRPTPRTGEARQASRAPDESAKGTASPGRAKKSMPAKDGGMKPAKSKKPSKKR